MSNDILVEMEKMIVLTARREMVADINSNPNFALIADESADISKKKQLLVSFRTVSSTYEIRRNSMRILPCTDE